jgi:hypothetical protein
MTTNTLTNLAPDLYAALDVVSRELVGMIPAVTLDANASRAAKDQNVRVPIAPAASAGNITPAMSVPAEADQTFTNTAITISKARAVPFSWDGEEQIAMNSGPGYLNLRAQQMAQAMRTLANEVEADLTALHATASRAYGTAGTTPFASDLSDAAQVRKILKDNGAPDDIQLVVDTSAGAKLHTMIGPNGYRAEPNMAFGAQGVLVTPSGIPIRESGQIVTSTAGAMASATSTSAAFTVGQTVIPLATAGTGVVAAGDVITFANDTNKYVVASVSFAGANPASGDTITIAAPGIRMAQGAATRAITVIAAAARNIAFSKSAIILVARMPARPAEGDMAIDVMEITDPRSGLTFEVSMYPGYRKVRYEIALAWGVKNIKPAHTALVLG